MAASFEFSLNGTIHYGTNPDRCLSVTRHVGLSSKNRKEVDPEKDLPPTRAQRMLSRRARLVAIGLDRERADRPTPTATRMLQKNFCSTKSAPPGLTESPVLHRCV